MRVALLGGGHAPPLAKPIAPAEWLLARRGFTPGLTAVPGTVAALARGDFDLAHAFSVPDAAAALAWRRLTGRPVVFTVTDPISRATVADRRLRLPTLRRAAEQSDSLLAASPEVRESIRRWLALDAPVLGPDEHESLYRRLT